MIRDESCMGGWCAVRQRCPYYRPGDALSEPVERMCMPGQEVREVVEARKRHESSVGADLRSVMVARGGHWQP